MIKRRPCCASLEGMFHVKHCPEIEKMTPYERNLHQNYWTSFEFWTAQLQKAMRGECLNN